MSEIIVAENQSRGGRTRTRKPGLLQRWGVNTPNAETAAAKAAKAGKQAGELCAAVASGAAAWTVTFGLSFARRSAETAWKAAMEQIQGEEAEREP